MPRLISGGAVLDLLPEVGGAVGRFAVDGVDMLRPAEPGTRDPLKTACFALLPFANRISNGEFVFAGRRVRLPRNFGDHPHALHGQGWQNPWQVMSLATDRAVLAFEHKSDSWPWAYRAEQRIALSPRGLRLELNLVNCCMDAMPASVGFHPYFIRRPSTMLRAEVAGVWLSDAGCIPTAPAGPSHFLDLARGAAMAQAPFVDHVHFGWSGSATVFDRESRGSLVLTASPELRHIHIFNPRDEATFCVEPVSAIPDAFNRETACVDVHVIAPGDSLSVWMELALRGW